MNWVRYSHFAGAMQGQKPFPDGNHNGYVKSPDAAFKLHPSSLRRTPKYASFLGIRAPCLRLFYEAIPFSRLFKTM
jgi:hypothetical protein